MARDPLVDVVLEVNKAVDEFEKPFSIVKDFDPTNPRHIVFYKQVCKALGRLTLMEQQEQESEEER
jgi:hypothetical protein